MLKQHRAASSRRRLGRWPLGPLAGVTLLGAAALAACGSDSNTGAVPAGGGTTGAATGCATGTLNGEGSSAQKNAIDEVISSFQDACSGATVNYNPTGSGAGVKQFTAGQVDFAGSDSPLNPAKGEVAAAAKRCQGNPAWNLPMVAGPIAISYNLPGVTKLILTPEVAAKIFLGQISTWNDPAIAAVNPGTTLPATAVTVFFRSDESGTTDNFTRYLNAAAPTVWNAAPGKAWTGKGEGREKSAGVADGVKSTAGGISYVEWSYAKDNKLGIAQVDNGGGAVPLTGESAGKTLATATQAGQGNDLALKLDYTTKQPGTYPIVLVTYEIVCSKGLDTGKTALVKAFLKHYSSAAVQRGLEGIGYAPLPAQVAGKVTAAIQAVQ